LSAGRGGSFGNGEQPDITFSGTAGTSYTLRWTISNAPCTASTDDVVITFQRNPTVANAGPDQTGAACADYFQRRWRRIRRQWERVRGRLSAGREAPLATRAARYRPSAEALGRVTRLRWTISNAPCTPSTDERQHHFPTESKRVANAGPDQTGAAMCGLTSTTLAANTPAVGTGAWSIVSGAGGSFGKRAARHRPSAEALGRVYTLRWTISNAPCTASTDDVVITFQRNPTVANAGYRLGPPCAD